jgi:dCTP deaminase
MILSYADLKTEIESGAIQFDPPLKSTQWGQASLDLPLGHSFTSINPAPGATFSVAQGLGTIGRSGLWAQQELKSQDARGRPESITLEPNEFILALTYQKITVPKHLIALVEGRSTYARVGLTMHQTAPWIQPGWSGRITLEIRNSGPLQIALTPVIDVPCQITFFRLTTPLEAEWAYGAHGSATYQDQQHPLNTR